MPKISELYNDNPITSLNDDGLIPVDQSPITNSSTGAIKRSDLFSGNYGTAVTVGFSNADYICDGTADDVQIQLANNALSLLGGGVIFLKGSSTSYSLTSRVTLSSNITLMGESLGSVTIISSIPGSAGRGPIHMSNAVNMKIKGITFNISNTAPAISSYGHNGLIIEECGFTGSSTSTTGIINFYGNNAVAPFLNSIIRNNNFYNMRGTGFVRSIYLFSKSGNTITDTEIYSNYFTNVYGPSIYLDNFDIIKNTNVHHNYFINIPGGGTTTNPGIALTTRVSDNGSYYVQNLDFHHNFYNNSLTTSDNNSQTEGVVYAYSGINYNFSHNTCIGSWTSITATVGPCFAVGRTSVPQLGLSIDHNYIQGFDSPLDFDSTQQGIIDHNNVVSCGHGFVLGYNTQNYVSVESNMEYDSGYTFGLSSAAYVLFGNSNKVKCSYRNNTIYSSGSNITSVIQITGSLSYNNSDVTVEGNRFNLPNSTITSFMTTENPATGILPTRIFDNEVQDSITKIFYSENVSSYLVKTGAYTILPSDSLINYTSGTVSATLPTAVGITGHQITIKNSGSGAITVATTSAQTIDGASIYSLASQYKYVIVISNGANWIIVGNN